MIITHLHALARWREICSTKCCQHRSSKRINNIRSEIILNIRFLVRIVVVKRCNYSKIGLILLFQLSNNNQLLVISDYLFCPLIHIYVSFCTRGWIRHISKASNLSSTKLNFLNWFERNELEWNFCADHIWTKARIRKCKVILFIAIIIYCVVRISTLNPLI